MSTPNPYAPPLAQLDAQPLGGPTAMLASRSSRLGASLLDGLLYGSTLFVAGIGAALATFASKRSLASSAAPAAPTPGLGLPPAAIVMMVVGTSIWFTDHGPETHLAGNPGHVSR
jgi:hypothetical protein